MKNETIMKLFDCIIENKQNKIDAHTLSKYGINNKDLSFLLNKEILKRKIKGEYRFYFYGAYSYLKKLSKDGFIDEALNCFMKLENICEPDGLHKQIRIWYQIFKILILKNNYNLAYEYFAKINNNESFFYQTASILFNYLLDQDIPAIKEQPSFGLANDELEVKLLSEMHDFKEAFRKFTIYKINSKFDDPSLSESKINILKILLNTCIEKQNELIGNIFDFYTNTGVNFEIACLQFGLDAYQINILKLLIAKHYYSLSDFENGDLYYYSVIESKYQNDVTKSLIEELEEKENLRSSIITSKLVDKLSRKKNS